MRKEEYKIKYIESGSLSRHEINKEKAKLCGTYSAEFYLGNTIHHVEYVRDGEIVKVVYKESKWPNKDIEEWHAANYSGLPYDVQTSKKSIDDQKMFKIYRLNEKAECCECNINTIDNNGNLVIEDRLSASGNLFERNEYEYNNHNELIVTRVYGPNGELYDEIFNE